MEGSVYINLVIVIAALVSIVIYLYNSREMSIKKHFLYYCTFALIVTALSCTIPSSLFAAKKGSIQLMQKRSPRIATKSRPRVEVISRDPYLGAIVIDAASKTVLVEDNADVQGYPASMVKMMNLLVMLEALDEKHITLDDEITVSAAVSRIGGSQVYLKENEVFTVDDLLYALMIQSANDAAAALATYYAGSKEAFVYLMNKRAQELGMKETTFQSVHGLPPGRGQLPDVSTPRDITKLALELLKHPEALKYASTKVRSFRTDAPEPFIMRNRNKLVRDYEGCDGLKTGFFWAAGFSIAATAVKEDARVITVIMGSAYSKVRDQKAREFLSKGFVELAALKPVPSAPQQVTASMSPWGNQYYFALALIFGVIVIRKFNK